MARPPFTSEKILKAIQLRYKWDPSSWRLMGTKPFEGSPEYLLRLSVRPDVLSDMLAHNGVVKLAGHTLEIHSDKQPLVPKPFHEKRKGKAKK